MADSRIRRNPSTLFVEPKPSTVSGVQRPSCEVAFVTAWPAIRQICGSVRRRTLAIFAIDDANTCIHTLLDPHPTDIRTAIIGRHTAADLCLPKDEGISLRHLALVLHPTSPHDPHVRFRLLDLRTSLGLTDERGRPVEHLAADGPLLVQVGSYALVILPLEPHRRWPLDPKKAWEQLPERRYTRETPGGGTRGAQQSEVLAAFAVPGTTGVQVVRGPRFAEIDLEGSSEQRVGRLEVRSPRGRSSLVLGQRALQGGVLLGRYDRCDNAGLPVLSDHRISRVHLLFLSVAGQVFVIDTASTNGVWSDNTVVRHRRLGAQEQLELGSELAHVSWSAY
ncbi:MAG: FHA domain-containing protein [Myxococcales bacterium]|nr:FHA domain-containing protein [Myxococcales bacterium]